jgi:uncharacterized protein YndB with AHSA1/START domain
MREASLIAAGDKPVLRFERFLPRPVEDVWRAVTDPAEMKAWFPTRIDVGEWRVGARFEHHFEGGTFGPLPGVVLEYDPPHRLAFTWGEDTIGFALTPTDGGTTFVLTEELGRSIAARNAAGWEVCLDRLVEGVAGEDWQPRFDRYVKEFEPVLGPQEGPPTGAATT